MYIFQENMSLLFTWCLQQLLFLNVIKCNFILKIVNRLPQKNKKNKNEYKEYISKTRVLNYIFLKGCFPFFIMDRLLCHWPIRCQGVVVNCGICTLEPGPR